MVKVGRFPKIELGNDKPLVLIAGPCVIETEEQAYQTAAFIKELAAKLKIHFIFKCSYDKANRTSIKSFRGPGIKKGLAILKKIKDKLSIPVLIDVHKVEDIKSVSEIADIIQIPAFLCRQTDFVASVANCGKPVNVKKGQFLAPEDIRFVIEKIESAGNKDILLTERGTSFGYHNLVVDMRSLEIMKETGYPVIFDATHSIQRPAALGFATGGDRRFVPALARAAVAVGIAGIFLEVHPQPDKALSDGPNMLKLDSLKSLLVDLQKIDKVVK